MTTWNSESLTQDEMIDGDLLVNGELNLNGYKLTVNGNMIARSTVETGMFGMIIVDGDYTQKSGSICVRAGKIEVKGNLYICGLDSNGNRITGTSSIIDSNSSIIDVDKNIIFDSTSCISLEGTYYVKGDFISNSIARMWYGTVNLCGEVNSDKKQTINIGKGKISTISLKCCPAFYSIPSGCYDKIVYN